jgi:hypothetical protein
LVTAAQRIEKAAFTRADLIEVVGAQLPVDTEHSPRALVESAVDHVGVRLTASRQPHQREGHERFTLETILAEEAALLDLVDARDVAMCERPCGSKTPTPRLCRRIRNVPSRTSRSRRGWCSR